MDILEKLMSFLVSVIAFLFRPMRPTFALPPSLPSAPPSANDPEIPHPESPLSDINDESSSPQSMQPSAPSPSANDLEIRQTHWTQPQPSATPPSAKDLEILPSQSTQPSAPGPSANDLEILIPQSIQPSAGAPSANDLEILPSQSTPRPPTLTTPSNLNGLESILAAQNHLQLKNSVLSFCFSYALAVALQYRQTHHQANNPDSSFVLLSFPVLLTFILILAASFISPSYTKTSEILDKAAFLVAAAAFFYATAIPFPFELKCAVMAVFLLSLLLITIFEYLNCNNA